MRHKYKVSLAVMSRGLVAVCGAAAAIAMVAAGAAEGPSTTLVSRAYDGGPALTRAQSNRAAISSDGRFVAFISNAVNLTSDATGAFQVFVRDRVTGAIDLVSRTPEGAPANGACTRVAINGDGRFVAFASVAQNLTGSAFRGISEVFVRDRAQGTTECVSVNTAGERAQSVSAGDDLGMTPDGRLIVFDSRAGNLVQNDANSAHDVFVRDRQLNTTELISAAIGGGTGNQESGWGGFDISDDGKLVAFCSRASNLVPSDTNGVGDVFVRDRFRRVTDRVSLTDSDAQAGRASYRPSISGTGRWVAFQSQGLESNADDRFRVSLRDRTTGRTELVSVSSAEVPGDLNAWDPAISADGRLVAFRSDCTNLALGDPDGNADMLIRDRVLGTTARVGPAVGGDLDLGMQAHFSASLSLDGRFLAVVTPEGGSVVGGDYPRSDVVVYDRVSGSQEVVSSAVDGSPGTKPADSSHSSMSADGRWVAYVSDAYNLVPGDANGVEDVFVTEIATGITGRVSVSTNEDEANEASSVPDASSRAAPGISDDGRYIAYMSSADNLAPGDTNGTVDAFVRDRLLGTTELVSVMNDGSPSRPTRIPRGAPSISGNGRFVAFTAGDPARPVTPDGLYRSALFVRDLALGRTDRVSVTTSGATVDPVFGYYDYFGRPSLSRDGRYVAFQSSVNLIDQTPHGWISIYVRDRAAGTTERVSVTSDGQTARGLSLNPAMNAAGRFVAFDSDAPNLAVTEPRTTHVYVHDRLGRTTELVSLLPVAHYVLIRAGSASLSADGRFVAFDTAASFHRPTSPNSPAEHVWVHDRHRRFTELVSRWPYGEGHYPTFRDPRPATTISADGRSIAYHTPLSITQQGTDGPQEVFVTDRGSALPTAPPLHVLPISPTEIRLTWRDLSTNESGFVVERRTGSIPGSPLLAKIATLGRNVTTYTSGGLFPGGAYTFRVRAFNWRGDSPNSNLASTMTLPPPPSAPINLTAQALSTTEIKLTWRDTSGTETGFKIERKGGVNGFFAQIGAVGANLTTFTSTGLFPGSTYSYRVRAHNGPTNSAYSNVVEGTTRLR